MPYQDRFKGRKIQDPPSSVGRFALFLVVGAAFAAFVGTLRGLDSSLCALATLCMVACKLSFELIASKANFKLPERFAKLPLAAWLLFWLLPVPPLWFVLRNVWPKNVDPNGAMGFLTMLCLALYVPTILAILKPVDVPDSKKKALGNQELLGETAESGEDTQYSKMKVNFDVDEDGNAKIASTNSSSTNTSSTNSSSTNSKSGKYKEKQKKKGKNR